MEQRIKGTTGLLALIGSPVGHSKSPEMYNYCFKKYGCDCAYLAFDVTEREVGKAVNAVRTFQMRGANVTMPLKNAVLPYLDRLTPAAQITRSVNTIVNDGGVLTGHCTDGKGFTANLASGGFGVKDKKITILGGGGVSSAVAAQCVLEGAEELSVFNRKDNFWESLERYAVSLRSEALSCSVYIYDLDDEEALKEFMSIKYENKVRLAKYIKEHNGIEVDPRSIFDVQVKRLHEYKRQFLNILHVMYLYNEIKEHPEISFYPRTFIFGAKASAGYIRAKQIIKLINSVADVVNNDRSINGKLKVVFIEDYRVSNAEIIFAAADVSEQISTASKEASGTGNMKFMLNGAPTLGTMDGANVEIVEEVGAENAFIFGLSSDEVINYENNGGYNPMDIYNSDADIRRVVNQLVDGTYSQGDKEMYRDLYNSLLTAQGGSKADTYFILKDFRSYADTQKKVEEAYRDKDRWAKMALLNTASCGKFSSDRTIQEYVDDIWHLDKVTVEV